MNPISKLDRPLAERLSERVHIIVIFDHAVSLRGVAAMVDRYGTVRHVHPRLKAVSGVVPLYAVPRIAESELVRGVEMDQPTTLASAQQGEDGCHATS